MNMDKATKQQLLQIALHEECSMSLKYEACRTLQLRWSEDMLQDLVLMFGKGEPVFAIAEYLGTTEHVVHSMINKYRLRRVGA